MKELDKAYDPSKVEQKIYEMWENGGYFKPEVNKGGKPFTIILPPPNITGQLHMGHAFDSTIQDVLIRYNRMKGCAALWLPGTDHASIATEVKVVAKIFEEEGLRKHEIGREEFLKRAWEWSDFYRDRIVQQLRKMGASCDWSRERFTMDEGCSRAVKEAFVRLYEKGLIYRDYRIINWCPKCRTALSDAEVEYSESQGHLWHIKYPIKDSGEFVIIATTRPETMLGDSGVAVNPNDERYKRLIGRTAVLPLMNRDIPIVADEYVDMDYATGCVKMTPCHDPNDFEVGQRHNLEQFRIMDDEAVINELGGKYAGLDRYEARKAVVEDLTALGLIVKVEDIVHSVGGCYRCSCAVEPITSMQWFVKMKPLAAPAIEAVSNKDIQFVPDRFKKIYFTWMENIRDWCISRQLWWGHRIPAYYCESCEETVVSKTAPEKCPKCGCLALKQDEDVLDTWFSSALWPFSTMGWPENTADLKKFYPNDVLVTAYDIIFFWVARMIFSGIEYMNEPPFHHVYIHGLVRDELGRKMSKSLNNGVDPLEMIDKYGADALRFTLLVGNSAGNDTRWQEAKIQHSRGFANKLNNAARFILMNLEGFDKTAQADRSHLINLDKWIISRVNEIVGEATANIEKYEIGIALEKIYSFVWDEFCDWYIEFAKPRLSGDDPAAKTAVQHTLYNVFIKILKLLHPFMPYITEQIYSHFNDADKPLIVSAWPEYSNEDEYKGEHDEISEIIEGIRAIRNARVNMGIPPSKKAKLYITPAEGKIEIYRGNEDIFVKLAGANEVFVSYTETDVNNALTVVVGSAKYTVPIDELIDKQKEIERLDAEKDKILAEIARVNQKLSQESFLSKAPPEIVEKEREKLRKNQSVLNEIEESIKKLS